MTPAVDGTDTELTQARGLRRMKLVALVLLLLMAVVYWLTLPHAAGEVWIGYLNAFAEAAISSGSLPPSCIAIGCSDASKRSKLFLSP